MSTRGRGGLLSITAVTCVMACAGAAVAAPGQARPAVQKSLTTGRPGPPRELGAEGDDSYRPHGERVRGTAGADDAPPLRAGHRYTDSVAPGQSRHYAVELDADSTAYVSAVAVPRPGAEVRAYQDGIEITLESPSGHLCGRTARMVEATGVAQPLADYASRLPGSSPTEGCRSAGRYLVTVERNSAKASDTADWPLELQYTKEAPVTGGATAKPTAGGATTSAAPQLPDGPPVPRAGGAGFDDAGAVSTGAWRDTVGPGETRFYRVPVDWGQRLSADVELPDVAKKGKYLTGAASVRVHNPARGFVVRDGQPYDGRRAVARVDTVPVSYGNRYKRGSQPESTASLAGWYYVAVTLHPDLHRFFPHGVPITLRISVHGRPEAGPDYADDGDSGTRFQVTGEDRRLSRAGQASANAPSDGGNNLRSVAYASFGTGTALLLWLAGWSYLARRRSPAPRHRA